MKVLRSLISLVSLGSTVLVYLRESAGRPIERVWRHISDTDDSPIWIARECRRLIQEAVGGVDSKHLDAFKKATDSYVDILADAYREIAQIEASLKRTNVAHVRASSLSIGKYAFERHTFPDDEHSAEDRYSRISVLQQIIRTIYSNCMQLEDKLVSILLQNEKELEQELEIGSMLAKEIDLQPIIDLLSCSDFTVGSTSRRGKVPV